QMTPETTVKKLFVYLNGSPGAGKSYTFIGRKNNVNTALVVVIADGATSGNDVAHDIDYNDHDYWTLIATPAGNPTAREAHWGFVSHKSS
ncbi:unnamed protein product, partial [marine sediment metagenome]